MNARTGTGELYIVTGTVAGEEAFLGRAVAAEGATLELEGRALRRGPCGGLVLAPFATARLVRVAEDGPALHRVVDEGAREEARELLAGRAEHVPRALAPRLTRWLEAAAPDAEAAATAALEPAPLQGSLDGFRRTAEELRGALLRAPGLDVAQELDRLSELEGDLVIELGRVSNRIALLAAEMLAAEPALARHVAALGPERDASGLPAEPWALLFERLRAARAWGLARGRTALVRDVNQLVKQAVHASSETILEHCAALDTLVAESAPRVAPGADPTAELTPVAAAACAPRRPATIAPGHVASARA